MHDAPKHEVAMVSSGNCLDEAEEVRAPDLEALCRWGSDHPEAKKISRASREKLLRCDVCGTSLTKKFGRANTWGTSPGCRGSGAAVTRQRR